MPYKKKKLRIVRSSPPPPSRDADVAVAVMAFGFGFRLEVWRLLDSVTTRVSSVSLHLHGLGHCFEVCKCFSFFVFEVHEPPLVTDVSHRLEASGPLPPGSKYPIIRYLGFG